MVIVSEELSLEVKQKIEEFDFKQKQEKERLQYNLEVQTRKLSDRITGYAQDKANDAARDFIEFIASQNTLKFTFGKYKGYYVDIILHENIDYCEWFSENVRGKDFNTLQILDYIHKKLNAKSYYFMSLHEAFEQAKQLIPLNMIQNFDENKKDILDPLQYTQPKRNYHNSYDYNDEPQYPDDVCNDLCYWGDPILGEGDLC